MSPQQLYVVVLAVAALLVVGVLAVRAAYRIGMPSLLLYLFLGLAVGESGLGVNFSDAALAELVGTLLLAVILTEGGLSTRWSELRPVVTHAGVLATVGVMVSVSVTAGLVHLALDTDLRTSLLLGSVASSTDAAAVFSIMRRLPVQRRTRFLLEAESGFNDPPVIVLVMVIASDAWQSASPSGMVLVGVWQLLVGAVAGLLVAVVGRWLLARSALPASGLYPLATLAIAMTAFSTAGLLGASGLLACYVAGLWLGNATLPHRQVTEGFTEAMAWLAQIGLFVMLGLLASPARLPDAVVPALVVGSALTFIARPVSVLVCSLPFRMPLREQVFVSWAGLRGAVPIVLATIPMTAGLPSAERIFDTVFLLVIVFTLAQGPLLPLAARLTGVLDRGLLLDMPIESAPLADARASLVQLEITAGSRLAGLTLLEVTLPRGAVVSLVVRDDTVLVPGPEERLRTGDRLVIAVASDQVEATEARLRALARAGRLARWFGEHGRR